MKRPELFQFLAREYFAPGVLSSKQLSSIAINAKEGLSPASWIDRILGEVLFRYVCYRGDLPDTLLELTKNDELSDFRHTLSAASEEGLNKKIFEREHLADTGKSAKAIDYYNKRLRAMKESDGLIPLLHRADVEAIAMPFTFSKLLLSEESGFFEGGDNPRRLKQWQEELNPLSSSLRPEIGRISLSLPLGPFAEVVGGGSLVLPLLLSLESTQDPFAPSKHSYLATGTFDRDKNMRDVDGVEEKALLAKRMDLPFIGPFRENLDSILSYDTKDQKVEPFVEKWKTELGTNPQNLSPENAYRILRDYESKMIRRKVTSESAIKTLSEILKVLKACDEYGQYAWRVQVCLGNAYNHLGNTKNATQYLEPVIGNLEECKNSRSLIEALCSLAVSEADEGNVVRSRNYAQKASDMSKVLQCPDPRTKIRLKIQALGSLGAQSLLQLGAWDDDAKKSSKESLDQCLSLADSLIRSAINPEEGEEASNDWAQSHGQLAWWYAFNKPKVFILNFGDWEQELHSKGEAVFKGQSAYLHRGRWHAAFRLALHDDLQDLNWLIWPLPKPDRGHEKWLKGLSLKYRGFLNSRIKGENDAKTDFSAASAIFESLYEENSESHIFEYIRASIKVLEFQAFEDFEAKKSAEIIFREMEEKNFYVEHPKASPQKWLQFLESSDDKEKTLVNPQTYFVY